MIEFILPLNLKWNLCEMRKRILLLTSVVSVVLTLKYSNIIFSTLILFLIGGILPGTNIALSSTAMFIGSVIASIIFAVIIIKRSAPHDTKKGAKFVQQITKPLFVSRRDTHSQTN